jgi:hypothetical protein
MFSLHEKGLSFMARFFHSICTYAVSKSDKFLLALSWAAGFCSGCLIFRYAGSDLVTQMPLAVNCQPSIFGLLTSVLLPFLFSAFAVYISVPKLLCVVSFLKACLFAYMSSAVYTAFSGAGWLVRWLFLFTDICGTVLLYHYWHRHITGVRAFSRGTFFIYQTVLFLVVFLDVRFVSPLLRHCLS